MIEIPLTQGQVALIDDGDAEVLLIRKWYCCVVTGGYKYAASGYLPHIYMHRVLLGVAPGQFVDHVNQNGLDNRRQNLRICTVAQNLQNSRRRREDKIAPYKGITPHGHRWIAQIKIDRKSLYLGLFAAPISAALAYDAAARQYFGKFARLNFPEEVR